MRRSLLPALLCLSMSFAGAGPAHADAEVETIRCHGRLDGSALSTPGNGAYSGHLSCDLGHGGATGYEEYQSFQADMTALVDNQTWAVPVPGVYFTVATLAFEGPDHSYWLQFNDWNVRGNLSMLDPENDYILFGSSAFRYHVRFGRVTTCPSCPPTLLDGNIDFVAEYVYDLPVA